MADTDNKKRRYKVTVDGKELGGNSIIDGQFADKEAVAKITDKIKATPGMKAVRRLAQTLASVFSQLYRAELDLLLSLPEDVQDLAPFLEKELKAAREAGDNPAFDCFMLEVWRGAFTADGKPIKGNPFAEIVTKAEKQRAAYTSMEAPGAAYIAKLEKTLVKLEENADDSTVEALVSAAGLPKISYKNSKELRTVTDKLMAVFFAPDAPISEKTPDGQRAMIPLRYEGSKSKKEITLYYDYEYDENLLAARGIPKGFGSYESFVATALDNLRDNGNEIVTYTKILEVMGIQGGASQQIEKLANAILKGATTITHIDDRAVQEAWGTGAERYQELVGQVFPVKLINERFIVNGRITDGAVKILDYSLFRGIAESIGHVTTWDKTILQAYTGRRTPRYWNVLAYLVRQIGWMRNKKSKRGSKILYESLYAFNGDKTTREKQLTREMTHRLLTEVFKTTGYITAYKEDTGAEPGVILTLAKELNA